MEKEEKKYKLVKLGSNNAGFNFDVKLIYDHRFYTEVEFLESVTIENYGHFPKGIRHKFDKTFWELKEVEKSRSTL
jgi:hypothetical protein